MKVIIDLKNAAFLYPSAEKRALEEINLSVMEGEFLAVMGENGAGKTTFCKLLNGIIPHLSGGNLYGNVTVDGERTDESSVPRLALKVGMVLDDPDVQFITSSVRNEAAFGPENLLLPPEEIEERIRQALSVVGLEGFMERSPSTLSGGEKQRLAIAAALAMKSRILVLDEPLSRLDPEGKAEVMSVLNKLREKYKITVVMTAHTANSVLEFADRACILKNGRIAACDTAKKIFENHVLLKENGIEPPGSVDINAVFEEMRGKESAEAAITINNLCFDYADTTKGKNGMNAALGACIKNINLTIEDNDFIALIGRNGCGKTTLLKLITGLLRPVSGEIIVRGKNLKELSVSAISKEIGFVMQNPDNQLFTDSVFNEIAFALKNAGLSKLEISQRVKDALSVVELEDGGAFPHALSKADRTKTVVACVLAMGCKIIIFDEIDVGQDYRGSIKIMNIAKELHSKGFTVIFVTHNMSLVYEYAHRLIKMEKGEIVMDMKKNKQNVRKITV
ncbi:MAG: ATP-binding cassette domain-containing protein [Treponema sp.]|nr:ATP-binding cassette domain-containing protein [Treponema sp.]